MNFAKVPDSSALENPVKLYLYDLTKLNKWNKAFRFSVLAINSNNVIPHTTVVVFDTEYYYGESGVATLLTPVRNPLK